VKKNPEELCLRVLELEKIWFAHAGSKYFISLSHIYPVKEIRSGKQAIITQALRAGKARDKVTQ